ncbi:hypothetical protein [Variovorax sp. J31P207]|uniref:hypothetical protein n=1 Tax=Variovorax sp. J31P207 TaxID=3053510 RepID=UPI00257554CD|nr:hypothetical protein [Variovorax sp. J31P207]MDM0072360.1 hypothetical protein [Variovorax sp. J31P207]
MEKVKTVHRGRFTLKGYGLRTGDSRFFAAFLVTEHRGKANTEIKGCSTGDVYDLEVAAVEAGFAAAAAWLEEYRPANA